MKSYFKFIGALSLAYIQSVIVESYEEVASSDASSLSVNEPLMELNEGPSSSIESILQWKSTEDALNSGRIGGGGDFQEAAMAVSERFFFILLSLFFWAVLLEVFLTRSM